MRFQGVFIDEEVHTRPEPMFVGLRNSLVYEADYARILDMVASGQYIWLDTDANVLLVLRAMDAGAPRQRATMRTTAPVW